MSEEGTLIDKRQKGWSALDNWFVDDYGPEVGPYGYAVYCVILRHCDAGGNKDESCGGHENRDK